MLRWMGRAAVEMIAQSGLGYSFDTLTGDTPDHPYIKTMKQFQPVLFSLILPRQFLPWLTKNTSLGFRRALLDMTPWPTLHKARDMIDLMHRTSIEILDTKKRALEEGDEAVERQVAQGKDILSILLRANMEAKGEDVLPESELLAHITTLIFAAMDTTSIAMSRTLNLLAENQDIQSRLREELVEARRTHGGDLSYDALGSLPYLDAVCRETLRLYPPISYVWRTCRKDAILPLSSPIVGVDGREMTEIAIPENTNVAIAIMAANRNPALWGPDAAEWKPDRWLSPLPESVTSAHTPGIYSNLMTFLGGGRSCIGFKFSQLEMSEYTISTFMSRVHLGIMAEAVLSVMVESFVFSLPKEEIVWNMTAIATPTVKGAKGVMAQMPLKMELVKGQA
ncbi:hypothetical protein HGRIS_003778 [Hohenbuehelia grisea]|uniref:Cytochrome P450 n=1 Tax=Hohenbuehelia grisea TaxID=104357 RepID=A0ABR3JGS5_9AGAR